MRFATELDRVFPLFRQVCLVLVEWLNNYKHKIFLNMELFELKTSDFHPLIDLSIAQAVPLELAPKLDGYLP